MFFFYFTCDRPLTTAGCVRRDNSNGQLTLSKTHNELRAAGACRQCDQKPTALQPINFTNRVIPVWNSLPNYAVSADTVIAPLKQYRHELVWPGSALYNADLCGMGNRSLL